MCDVVANIPNPEVIKEQLVYHLEQVDLLKRLLKLSERKQRLQEVDHSVGHREAVPCG